MEVRLRRPVLGTIDVVIGAMVLIGVWGGLPTRWWPVDVSMTLVAVLLVAGGVGLLLGARWGRPLAISAAGVGLVAGLVSFSLLVFAAASIVGLYGPVGGGGAVILGVIA